MQTSLKLFELIPLGGNTSMSGQKIALRVNSNGGPFQDSDPSTFFGCLNALISLPEDKMKASLAKLEWIPVDEQGEFLAPVIDFSDNASMTTFASEYELQSKITGREGSCLEQAKGENMSLTISSLASVMKNDQNEIDETLNTFQGKWALKPILPSKGDEVPVNSVHLKTAKSGDESKVLPNQDYLWEEVPAKVAKQRTEMARATPSDQEGVLKNLRANTGNSVSQDVADRSHKPILETANAMPEKESNTSPDITAVQPKTIPLSANEKQRGLATDLPVEKNPKNTTDKLVGHNKGQETIRVEDVNRQPAALEPAQRQRHSFQSMETEAPMLNKTPDREESMALHRMAGYKPGGSEDSLSQVTQENTTSDGGKQEQQGGPTRENQQIMAGRIGSSSPETSQIAHSKEASEPQPAFRTLQDDVMRQIVQRMTLRNEGAQSKMSIQLKPEFLGNLKLQISTESQQVVVRMTAESTVVKEMIEANLSVLRNELQQHGLHIDKFDVFVGQEDPTWKQRQQNAALRQRRQGGLGKIKGMEDEESDEESTLTSLHPETTKGGRTSMNEIDFFA